MSTAVAIGGSRALVTGGAGTIGSHVVDLLVAGDPRAAGVASAGGDALAGDTRAAGDVGAGGNALAGAGNQRAVGEELWRVVLRVEPGPPTQLTCRALRENAPPSYTLLDLTPLPE